MMYQVYFISTKNGGENTADSLRNFGNGWGGIEHSRAKVITFPQSKLG